MYVSRIHKSQKLSLCKLLYSFFNYNSAETFSAPNSAMANAKTDVLARWLAAAAPRSVHFVLSIQWFINVVPTKFIRNATKLGGRRGFASNAATRSFGIQFINRRNLDKFTLQAARCDKCMETLKESDLLCAGNCQRGRHADCHKENPGSKAFKMCTYCEVSY